MSKSTLILTSETETILNGESEEKSPLRIK